MATDLGIWLPPCSGNCLDLFDDILYGCIWTTGGNGGYHVFGDTYLGFSIRPIVGVIADRTSSRWGKFRPYLLYLAVPFGLIGVLTFYTPPFGDAGKLVYAYITYSLMMMVYSGINVPYASLLGVMSPNPSERNTLSTYRMMFAYLGSFIALLLFMPMVNWFSGHSKELSDQQFGWFMAVVVIGVMCALLFLGCFAWTRERVSRLMRRKLL